MKKSSRRLGSLSLLCALFAGTAAAGLLSAAPPPALVVIISLDQFRADYLERFREHFGPGGFNLFLERGAQFADCHYRHSQTKTAPGHATIATGVHANLHGIIANDWIDRNTFEAVSNVGDSGVKLVGLPPSAAPRLPGRDPYQGRSPRNLLAATIGDAFKLARGGRPKVIGVATKDRSAILMAGHLADAAYFEIDNRMVSSSYYMNELPAWVRAWNEAGKVDAYFGAVWDRALPAAAYAAQGPDDAEGEFTGHALGRTLPKTVTGGEARPGPKFYEDFDNTPFTSEVVVDFARETIVQEQLGRRGVTDILCLGFSASDAIGHVYGPDSHEVMDNAVRMDRLLAGLFAFLDERVGLDQCTIVLTADHGVAPMPEFVRAAGRPLPAARVELRDAVVAAERALDAAFGPLPAGERWLVNDDTSLIFYPAALAAKKLALPDVETVARDALLAVPYVQAAYTRSEMERGEIRDELGRRMWYSFHRERSGDVFFQLKPFHISRRGTGSTHGTPYNYDTHVPLLWYGVGVQPGLRTERVGVDDIVPTLAHLLGIPAPPLAEGRVLF